MKVKGLNINYEEFGKGYDIVLLHGWGVNLETMRSLANGLKNDYKITLIDLPGFGKSEEPKEAWTLNDYSDMLEELLEKLNINNPILIGHSFGGRVGIVYAGSKKVKKLVLLSAPYRKNKDGISLTTKMFKTVAKLPGMKKISEYAKNKMGSTDYKKASPIMKKVLVNVVNENLKTQAENIKCPTLLIYGDNDNDVVIDQALELEKLIRNSGLVRYENCFHYAFLEKINQTIKILYSFFESERE